MADENNNQELSQVVPEEDSNNVVFCLPCLLPLLTCCLILLLLILFLPAVGSFLTNIWGGKENSVTNNNPSGGQNSNDFDLGFPDINISTEEMGNCIDEYIKSQIGENALYGHGEDIANAGKIKNVNPGFIVAIAQQESSLGTRITKGAYNYGNILPAHDLASWEDAINEHSSLLAKFIQGGQNTIIKIGNGAGGNYMPKDYTPYSPNNCDAATVGSYAYCPCGRTADGTGYGTSDDSSHDPNKVNQYWIPNVTKFFDQIGAKCGYFAPPNPENQFCWPTTIKTIPNGGHFMDPGYLKDADGNTMPHYGIDISPVSGQWKDYDVLASKAGIITVLVNECETNAAGAMSGCGGGFGNHIYIDHGNGEVTKYAHLKKDSMSGLIIGQKVQKGQKIARINNSGFSTGDHLHFEIRINDVAKDPETLLTDNCLSSNSACREIVLNTAKEKAGMYLNVGESCCAGFTSLVLDAAKQKGANISPNYFNTNWAPNFADKCSTVGSETCDPDGRNMGTRIENLNDILPGDLILFHRTYVHSSGVTYTHVGIMGENGTFYDCSGTQSRVNQLDSYYTSPEIFAEGRRICQDEAITTTCTDPNKFIDPIAKEKYQSGTCSHNIYEGDSGTDIHCPVGTPVMATKCGTIMLSDDNAYAPWSGASKGRIRIQHSDGTATYYTHLATRKVQVGQTVNAGDIIGTSGTANGVDHVHVGYYPYANEGDDVAVLHPKSLINKLNGNESAYPGWGYNRQIKFDCEVSNNVNNLATYNKCDPGADILHYVPINY